MVELAHERGCLAGKLLADMGADVVLVEPPEGSPMRAYPPHADDRPDPERSLYWWHYQTSKRGLTLDLTAPRGRELFGDLVAGADVVIECEDPGVMAARGVDYTDLAPRAPAVVWASVTPFGRDTERPGAQVTDLTVLAGGGPVWSCGYDDHSLPPVRGGGNQGYATACHYAVLSILTALLWREASGEGQHLDVSMHAAANVTTEMSSQYWLVARSTVQRQTGRHAMDVTTMPAQARCADGRHATTGVLPRTPQECRRLHAWFEGLGLGDQLPEAIFLEKAAAKESIDVGAVGEDDEVTAMLGAAREALNLIAAHVPAYDFFIGAQECGLTAGVIYAPEEVMEDPHFRARGFAVSVEHPEIGRSVTYPGAPYRFEKTPWCIQRRAPRLGEHTEELLAELGLDAAERERLRAEHVV